MQIIQHRQFNSEHLTESIGANKMTKINEQKRYWVWLSSLEGIGPVSFYELIAKFEDAKKSREALEKIQEIVQYFY